MTTYIFIAEFDGTLNLEEGDKLEIELLGKAEMITDSWDVAIIRQTGHHQPPPLGVSVSDNLDTSDRLA